jgi:hypothetical protein
MKNLNFTNSCTINMNWRLYSSNCRRFFVCRAVNWEPLRQFTSNFVLLLELLVFTDFSKNVVFRHVKWTDRQTDGHWYTIIRPVLKTGVKKLSCYLVRGCMLPAIHSIQRVFPCVNEQITYLSCSFWGSKQYIWSDASPYNNLLLLELLVFTDFSKNVVFNCINVPIHVYGAAVGEI